MTDIAGENAKRVFMIHKYENTESWEDKTGNTWKLGNSKLASTPLLYFHDPFLCIHHQWTTKFESSESFTPSPFEKMVGSWYPEFVHIHAFMGIHETINNNQEDLKH